MLRAHHEIKSIKLDAYDKKLLTYLFHDGRRPIADIAKSLRISPQRAQYKFERLQETLISPATILNYPELGIGTFIVLIERLDADTAKRLQAASTSFLLMYGTGNYEYTGIVLTEDFATFAATYLPNTRMEVHQVTRMHPDEFNLYDVKLPNIRIEPLKRPLDATDYALIEYFGKNTYQTFLQASADLGLDRITIKKRVDALRSANVILSFRWGIDLYALGLSTYAIFVETTAAKRASILQSIKMNKYAGFAFETHTGVYFQQFPKEYADLFAMTEQMRAIDAQARIQVMPVATYTVDPVPESAVQALKKRAGRNIQR